MRLTVLNYLLPITLLFNVANSASLNFRKRKGTSRYISAFNKALSDEEKAVLSLQEKRGLYFGLMISCETGRSFFHYLDYGCYCGLGGGGTPVDALDTCWKIHDNYYGDLIKNKICKLKVSTYIITFKYHGCSNCAETSEYSRWDKFGYETVNCSKALCDCDAAAAKMLQDGGL